MDYLFLQLFLKKQNFPCPWATFSFLLVIRNLFFDFFHQPRWHQSRIDNSKYKSQSPYWAPRYDRAYHKHINVARKHWFLNILLWKSAKPFLKLRNLIGSIFVRWKKKKKKNGNKKKLKNFIFDKDQFPFSLWFHHLFHFCYIITEHAFFRSVCVISFFYQNCSEDVCVCLAYFNNILVQEICL